MVCHAELLDPGVPVIVEGVGDVRDGHVPPLVIFQGLGQSSDMECVLGSTHAADLARRIAERTRVALEILWQEHDDFLGDYGAPASTGQCGRSSSVLVRLLSEELPDGDWRLAGGLEDVRDRMNAGDLVPDAQSGGMVWSGFWQDHYWVVSEAYGLIVDVTADQFGHEPVIVCGLDDPRYRENLLPGVADRHSMDWRLDVERWLEGIRPDGGLAPEQSPE